MEMRMVVPKKPILPTKYQKIIRKRRQRQPMNGQDLKERTMLAFAIDVRYDVRKPLQIMTGLYCGTRLPIASYM
eukprot:scaffold3224_cov158-Amphora_coffeaeformis.AAC.27